MKSYLQLLTHILENGSDKKDRTGTGTRSVFGYQMRFDLTQGLPLLTTKKIHAKSVIHELLWFLKGDTNVHYLQQNGVRIWNEWANDKGELGPIYGKQWRSWLSTDDKCIDQIQILMNKIRSNPHSRRLIVSSWNPSDLPDETLSPQQNVENGKMALAPCHTFFQFYVQDRKLSCLLYQRSCDVFLGLGFNLLSYALLTHMIAHQCDLIPYEFIWTGGDVHIYLNHFEQVKLQLSRKPLPLPQLLFKRKPSSIFDYQYDDFSIQNYESHPPIKAEISV